MAAIDPYAPCPCGSGQKFKWCCQGVEPVADRAHRLFEGNQIEAAFQALDEGLKKTPDNPWLLTRKALYELRRGRFEAAKPLLERVIAKQPAHVGAGGLLLRVILETEGPIAGVKVLQRMLSAVPIEALPSMAVLAQIVGMMLGETGHAPAAIEHLTLALELMPGGRRTGRELAPIRPLEPVDLALAEEHLRAFAGAGRPRPAARRPL